MLSEVRFNINTIILIMIGYYINTIVKNEVFYCYKLLQ